jgi:hypothetical protein
MKLQGLHGIDLKLLGELGFAHFDGSLAAFLHGLIHFSFWLLDSTHFREKSRFLQSGKAKEHF